MHACPRHSLYPNMPILNSTTTEISTLQLRKFELQVLLATEDGITVVDADSASHHAAGTGVMVMLAVAPNGQFVAGFTADGRLTASLHVYLALVFTYFLYFTIYLSSASPFNSLRI